MPFPNILFDGDEDPTKFVNGMISDDLRLCIQESAVTFYDLDLPRLSTFPSPDLEPFACEHPRLPAVSIAGVD
jgi:hypothetical protein